MMRPASLSDVQDRLARGDVLRMEIRRGDLRFWFEGPLQDVPIRVARAAMFGGAIREAGDSLFGLEGNSQTWLKGDGDGASD